MSKKIVLACEKCGSRNYKTSGSSETPVRFEIKKYCPVCRIHTIHRQA